MSNSTPESFISYRVPQPAIMTIPTSPATPGGDPSYARSVLNGAEDAILRWHEQMRKEGATFLASQRAWPHIDKAIDIIFGDNLPAVGEEQSDVAIHQMRTDFNKIVATYSNIRNIADYTCDNGDYETTTNVLNKCWMDWYGKKQINRRLKKVLQHAGTSLGYAYLYWDPAKRSVELEALGPKKVMVIQLGEDMDEQTAYATIIVKEVPIARAHALYPDKQAKLIPDRAAPTGVRKTMKKLKRAGSFLLGMLSNEGKMEDATTTFPTIDIFHTYVRDTSINDTGNPIYMGEPYGASWCYEVPSYHDTSGNVTMIPTGEMMRVGGENIPKMRAITRQECLLYPRGRLIISTRTVILSDGPNPWLHGQVPITPFRFDEWPDQWMGMPLTMGHESLPRTYNQLVRDMADSSRARLNPPYSWDESMTTDGMAAKIMPRIPGQRWKANHMFGDSIKFPFPPALYDYPQSIPALVESLMQKEKELMGVMDAEALTQYRQMPSTDSIDKILEAMGPMVQDRASCIEASIARLGYQFAGLVFQFYDVQRRLHYFGIDGITPEDFDLKPGELVPAEIPGKSFADRVSYFIQLFAFRVTPNSLHEITSMTRRLLFLQLQRSGFPIDPWTLAEINNIPNFGPPPEGTKNMWERYKYFQTEMTEFTAKIQGIMQQGQMGGGGAGGGGGVNPQLMQVLQNLMAGSIANNGGGSGGNPGVGRDPSGGKPPHLVSKDGGERSTISES